MKMHVQFGNLRENMGTVKVQTYVDDQLATKAELMFVVSNDEQAN
ncbi:Uncharacterised protein [Weissella viridescens]|nr:Uncharacterised protein [Weissella viridescens]